ncbi:MAG TPA: phosphoribosylglycinamide formyltransferase [Cyclobacteriaceae bacterium]|jgi:phosphoribosylglycinamide formyltransferase-1|nr:phosphoribosylglycinamide formyltransferase [Cyclobacteriaceae bacterium]
MNKKIRLAIFASGSGTNAEAIMSYFQHHPQIEVGILLSNNPNAFALERSRKFDVPTRVFDKQQFRESDQVLNWLKEFEITHIVLAGFLWLLPENLIRSFSDKIINIHPSLLPKFGGKGMYGMKVHEAVKAAGESESGITIHLVNAQYDEGRILLQVSCKISSEDSPKEIAAKVYELEYANYPKTIEKWVLEAK